jgi:hypothetical protein
MAKTTIVKTLGVTLKNWVYARRVDERSRREKGLRRKEKAAARRRRNEERSSRGERRWPIGNPRRMGEGTAASRPCFW